MKGIIRWFAENAVAANLLMILLLVGGLVSLTAIAQKPFPDIDVEIVQVSVEYLGAAPEEVEEGVCVRIEEEINGIEGVERITSTATEGACGVSAELISGYPVDRALSEIKNSVDGITTFPDETEKPIINHFTVRRNAIEVALWGDVEERALTIWGQRLRDEISALPGITQVELASARPYEISVEVSEASLRRHGLTFDDVAEAVRSSSLDLPGGAIKTRAGEIVLRTKGQAYTGDEFARLVVRTRPDGTRLLLGDVARVVDGFEDVDRSARFNGEPAVLVRVFRVGDQRIMDVVERVRAYVDQVETVLPSGLHLSVWNDSSQMLRDRVDILVRNGMSGFVLVFCVLALFLRLRLAFWVAIGVPIAFSGSFMLFTPLDMSIDVISVFAFILVLGLLVDDAIVVGENVHTHQERGEDSLQSAIRGAQEVAVPVIFGVLTTIAAFLPMILAPGTMGQVFGTIGRVVVCCLIFSMIESQWVLPAHLGHMKPRASEPQHRGAVSATWARVQRFFGGLLQRVAEDYYRPFLEKVLVWRYAALATGVVLLMLTATIVASGYMKLSFFPPIEADVATARLTMPQGTPAAVTEAGIAMLEDAALELKRSYDEQYGEGTVISDVFTSLGEQPSTGSGSPLNVQASGASNIGEVTLALVRGGERPVSTKGVGDAWRDATPQIADAEELIFATDLFSAGDPINIELQSPHQQDLEEAAVLLAAKVAEYPGVSDVADSFRAGKDEIRLAILPSAEPLGLTLRDLARQVRQAFYGEEAQRIQRGRDDIRVMVRYPEEDRRSLADLDNLRIRTPGGAEVPFYTVARAELGRGYANIKRADRQRVINVTAQLDPEEGNANQVLADLEAEFLPDLMARFPGLGYGLEGEQRGQRETLAGVRRNAILALLLIYALLAIPLRSYSQPLIIMSVIPFGLVGAVGGHILLGMGISMMSVFGVVALSGVVVNSSLVLVHYINSRRAAGANLREAVRDSGTARFRPIVLTSLTTFAGLAPILSEPSVSAQFLIPMATSLGFGVLFATSISLLLVPCIYMILEDLKSLVLRTRVETPAGLTSH